MFVALQGVPEFVPDCVLRPKGGVDEDVSAQGDPEWSFGYDDLDLVQLRSVHNIPRELKKPVEKGSEDVLRKTECRLSDAPAYLGHPRNGSDAANDRR